MVPRRNFAIDGNLSLLPLQIGKLVTHFLGNDPVHQSQVRVGRPTERLVHGRRI